VSPRTAFWITDILSDSDARAYVFGRGGSLEFPFPVAAKTGTSQAYHDNWAIGYTRDVTVGVWVGNFDRRPLTGSSGVAGAGPIFHAVMVAATEVVTGKFDVRSSKSEVSHQPSAISNQPSAISHTKETICALSGMRASVWCPTQTEEWTAGDSSTGDQECTWHVPRGGAVGIKWPQEYVAWARTQGVYDRLTPLPARASDLAARTPHVGRTPVVTPAAAPAGARASAPALRVVSPPDGAVYLIDPTLRRDFQTLPLRAAAAEPVDIEWRIDGRAVGRGTAGASIDWPLTAGAHVVTARDASGREARAAIVVK
jgi:penicillin-binding protein 1C